MDMFIVLDIHHALCNPAGESSEPPYAALTSLDQWTKWIYDTPHPTSLLQQVEDRRLTNIVAFTSEASFASIISGQSANQNRSPTLCSVDALTLDDCCWVSRRILLRHGICPNPTNSLFFLDLQARRDRESGLDQ